MIKMKSLREQYAPLLKELNGAIYQSKLHIESSEAISVLLVVIDSYNTSMKEDLALQVDLQKVINEQKQEIVDLYRTNRELKSMLAISQKDVSKLQKQLKETK